MQRLAEAERGVDIELGRVERGVEPGSPLAGGERIDQAAGDGLAVERRLQALDRDLVAAEASRRRAGVNGRRSPCAASARPSSQAASTFGSLASISAGPVKLTPSPLTASWPLSLTCVKPGARNSKRSRFHPLGIGADVAAQIRDAVAAERDLIDADADLDRNGGAEGAAGQLRDPADRGGRRRPRAVVAGKRAVEIDLPARQHAVEARMLAELEIGDAGELEPLLVRAVLEFELLHQRRGRARLDLAAQAPGLAQGLARCRGAARGDADRPRQVEVPSNRGLAPASVSVPSASMLSGRLTGSTLTCSFIAPSSDAAAGRKGGTDRARRRRWRRPRP